MKKPEIEKFRLLRQAGELIEGEIGGWIYDVWQEYDQRYFGNTLSPGGIQWGLTPHGQSLGYYCRDRNLIFLHQSLLTASSSGDGNPWGIGDWLGRKLAADVLLHEMIHQYLFQQNLSDSEDEHQSQVWCDELNRLSPMLELGRWYFVPWKRAKITVDAEPEIQGRYCDLTSKKEYKKPTRRVNVRVTVDEDVAARAVTLGKILAPARANAAFPHALRPLEFYTAAEQSMLKDVVAFE